MKFYESNRQKARQLKSKFGTRARLEDLQDKPSPNGHRWAVVIKPKQK